MKSITKEKLYDMIDAFNSTFRYLDDLLNIDNIHFEHMVNRIYPAELQLNKANASDTCHRLNCDHNQGGVMGSVLMCIFSVDKYIQ